MFRAQPAERRRPVKRRRRRRRRSAETYLTNHTQIKRSAGRGGAVVSPNCKLPNCKRAARSLAVNLLACCRFASSAALNLSLWLLVVVVVDFERASRAKAARTREAKFMIYIYLAKSAKVWRRAKAARKSKGNQKSAPNSSSAPNLKQGARARDLRVCGKRESLSLSFGARKVGREREQKPKKRPQVSATTDAHNEGERRSSELFRGKYSKYIISS